MILEFGSAFKRSALCSSELFLVKADTIATSPFFDGKLIELGAGGADVTVKKDGKRFFVVTQFLGHIRATAIIFPLLTEFKLGKSYRDLGFFSRTARSVQLDVQQLADGSHHFHKRRRPAFVWVQTLFLVLSMAGTGLQVMMVRGFNINMSDQ